jgi:hypothetical protein
MNIDKLKFSVCALNGVAIALPLIVLSMTPSSWPRWLFMWLLAVAIFALCKIVTWNNTIVRNVPAWRNWAYFFAWPGLNAARFLDPLRRPQTPRTAEWLAGALNTLTGGLIFWNANRLIPADWPIILGWAGIVGVGLMLHFGLFQLLSCLWRSIGVDAPPLMVSPLRSTSVTEFWSKRWNTAFRDFAHQFLFRPLTRLCGVSAALLISFLFSGVIHDVVISIPARGGYGEPTMFFLIQALAMIAEKSQLGHRFGLGNGWRGWLFTAIALLAPAQLLFHCPFINAVVIPFMHALGAA